MRPMRIAVWGLGRHAIKTILPAVSAVKGLELYGVCSRNASSVSICAAQWKCKGWTEVASMISDRNVDIIYVATPIGLHAQHGVQVLNAGKHLWCEKPLTCHLPDTLELLETARYKALSIGEGFMYLHHPQFRQLCAYISDGKFGKIRAVYCRFGIPTLEQPGFRTDPSLGGGALFDVGCYPISAIIALYPEENLHVNYANIITRDGSAVDTDGQALITLANGVVANLEWKINCTYRNEIDIWGDKGSVYTDKIFSKRPNYIPAFHFRDIHGTETTELGAASDHFVSMLQYFRSTIDDQGAAKAERNRIARRADVLSRILSRSRSHCASLDDQ